MKLINLIKEAILPEDIRISEIQKLAKQTNIDISKMNIKEIEMGMQIELEHGTISPDTNVTDDDPIKTFKIAIAHIREVPDYYTKLKKYVENA